MMQPWLCDGYNFVAANKLKLAVSRLRQLIDRRIKTSTPLSPKKGIKKRILSKWFAIGVAGYLLFVLIIYIPVSLVPKPNRKLPPLRTRLFIGFALTTPIIAWGVFIYIIYPILVNVNHRKLRDLADSLGISSLDNVLLESELIVSTLPWYPSEGAKAIHLFVAGSIQEYPLVMMECQHVLDPGRKYLPLKLISQRNQIYAIMPVLFLCPVANWPDLFLVPANRLIAAYIKGVNAGKVDLPKELAGKFIAVSNFPWQVISCLQKCPELIAMLKQDQTLHLQIIGGHLLVWNLILNRPISAFGPFEGPLPEVARLRSSVQQAIRVRQALEIIAT